jgi:CpeT protein
VRRLYITFIIAAAALAVVSCSKKENKITPSEDLKLLASWMSGSFSSQQQARADSNFMDIRLRMVPIWSDLTDGYWLYVEEAVANHEIEPYRQRIYHLAQKDDTTFISDVYAFDDPMRFTGAWRDMTLLADLTPDSLQLLDGCSIIIIRDSTGAFYGGTVGQGCASEMTNAAYATSEVRVSADSLVSWDRGFDADGNQIWGAKTGGYIFKKIS